MDRTFRHRTPAMRLLAVVAVSLALAGSAAAQRLIPFQGSLATAGGQPPAESNLDLLVAIYDQPAGGVPLWTEVHRDVDVSSGRFSILLGSQTPLADPNRDGDESDAIAFDADAGTRYVGLRVGGASAQEMVPRQLLVPAFYASSADSVVAGSADTDQIADAAVGTLAIADGAVTSEKLEDSVRFALPLGGVILWYGSAAQQDLPVGYELCDGGLVTTEGPLFGQRKPDLRDRFAFGATDDGSMPDVRDETNALLTGGSTMQSEGGVAVATEGHSLTIGEMPVHIHSPDDLVGGEVAHNHDDPSDRTCGASDDDDNFAWALGDPPALICPDDLTGTTANDQGDHEHVVTGELQQGFELGSTLDPNTNEPVGDPHVHPLDPFDNQPAYQEVFYIIRVN